MVGVLRTAAVITALALAAPGARAAPAEREGVRPPIVLITLDTTRRDHLGVYGYERETSPELDRLARESQVYTRAWSTSTWTLPAHASLFTGKFPTSHGARWDPRGELVVTQVVDDDSARDLRASPISPVDRTLAQILRDEGYATGAFVAGPWAKAVFGLDRGFDHYDDDEIHTTQGRSAQSVTDAALAWLAGSATGPFFLFVNYFDAHSPYADPDGNAGLFRTWDFVSQGRGGLQWSSRPPEAVAEMFAAYDGEIRYMDRHLGRLLDGLKELGVYDRCTIIATADHGESLGEHGIIGHGQRLWEAELRIPLIVKLPLGEGSAASIDAPVQLTDIVPMLLDRLEIPVPFGVQGVKPPRKDEPIFAEVYPNPGPSYRGSWRSLIDGRHKYVWNEKGEHALYDLVADPGERHNRIDDEPVLAAELSGRLGRFHRSLLPPARPPAPTAIVDEETRRSLESLGYVE